MKTYIKFFLAVGLMFAVGMVAAGTAAACEQALYRNFVNKATFSGTLPSEVQFANTAQIWQAQVETFHNAGQPNQADHQMSQEALAEAGLLGKPLWCAQRKCL